MDINGKKLGLWEAPYLYGVHIGILYQLEQILVVTYPYRPINKLLIGSVASYEPLRPSVGPSAYRSVIIS